MKRTALRPRSKRRQRDDRTRTALRVEMLTEFPWCFRCYWERATDLHEMKNRSQGGDYLNRAEIVTLCRDCHQWITDNPAQAHEAGWTFFSFEPVSSPSSYEHVFCCTHRVWGPVSDCCNGDLY